LYITPIFYPYTIVPDRFKSIYMLNPMAHLVNIYRDIFINNKMFSISGLLYFSLVSILIFIAGYVFFTKLHKKFVDLL
jgi:ABC-type polysaccharide/polyol phosphate export permease